MINIDDADCVLQCRVRVLVVDDSSTIRAMMGQVVNSDPDMTVAGSVASAAEADRILDSQLIDVITLDVEMPGMSGFQYLEKLRLERSLPVIMLSSSTAEGAEMRRKALAAGADGCFNKADAMKKSAELRDLIKGVVNHKGQFTRSEAAAIRRARR